VLTKVPENKEKIEEKEGRTTWRAEEGKREE
jgi:hypothetical protein